MNQKVGFKIGKKKINQNSKTYFIADIAANHDGSLNKAIDLIYSAKENGADAVLITGMDREVIWQPWRPWDWHVDNEVTALFLKYK